VNVNTLPSEVVNRIYQAATGTPLPTWQLAAAAAGWVMAGLGVLAFRYRGEGRQ